MNSCIIGTVSGEFENFETEYWEVEENGYELARLVEVRQNRETASGISIIQGRAAQEVTDRTTTYDISSESVTESEGLEKSVQYTEFIAIPGEFVLVENGKGTFASDLIGRMCNTLIERAEIGLSQFIADRPNADIWQIGFKNVAGQAEKGVVYGNEVMADAELGSVLDVAEKNQVGLDYGFNQDAMKVTMAESGFVELYQPSNYDADEFVEYVYQEVCPYVKRD